MDVKESKQCLGSILCNVQMGQEKIQSALKGTMRPAVRKALEAQLQEYKSIERDALHIAHSRGWELRELEPAAKMMARMVTKVMLSRGNTDSKLAAMMIKGNTNGLIAGMQELHQFSGKDPSVQTLSQKLIDCQTAGIRQMQGFL